MFTKHDIVFSFVLANRFVELLPTAEKFSKKEELYELYYADHINVGSRFELNTAEP